MRDRPSSRRRLLVLALVAATGIGGSLACGEPESAAYPSADANGSGDAATAHDADGGHPADGTGEADADDPTDAGPAGAQDVPDTDGGPTPHWPGCDTLSPTPGALRAKTTHLDALVRTQHLDDGLLRTVILDDDGTVRARLHLESSGLWTAMYLASQSFRFATTGEPEALEGVRIAVAGLHDLTAVTGVPGLYGRGYGWPDYAYIGDPADMPSGWHPSPAEGYEGWWYRGDVSKDTMDGILFGYAVALELVDDPEIQATVRADVTAFVERLVADGLQILDHEGEVTEHGRLYYSACDDFPGFNALLALSWLRLGIDAGASDDVAWFYRACMLHLDDQAACPEIDGFDLGSYVDAVDTWLSLYLPDCQTNYDNIDMVFHAIYPLIRRETDPTTAARLRAVLADGVWDPPAPQVAPPVHRSTHAFYTYLYGGLSNPASDDEVFLAALRDAACTLHGLPEDRTDRDVPPGDQERACDNRHGEPNAAHVIPLAERYYDNYIWRLDPYAVPLGHDATPGLVHSPDDYLVAYWAGRYHGFIDGAW